jgi:hypothetical protein
VATLRFLSAPQTKQGHVAGFFSRNFRAAMTVSTWTIVLATKGGRLGYIYAPSERQVALRRHGKGRLHAE